MRRARLALPLFLAWLPGCAAPDPETCPLAPGAAATVYFDPGRYHVPREVPAMLVGVDWWLAYRTVPADTRVRVVADAERPPAEFLARRDVRVLVLEGELASREATVARKDLRPAPSP